LSLRAVKILAGVVAVVTVAVGFLGFTIVSKSVDLTRLERLERRNQALVEEIDRTQYSLTVLQDTISAIAFRDQKIRLLAGLDPIDPDVQQAGIGGPIGTSSARELLLGETAEGQEALQIGLELSSLVRRANLVAASFDAVVDSLESHKSQLERTPSIMPTMGWLTSRFSRQRFHPIHHEARPHQGIDVAAPIGTPIVAPADGRVIDMRTKGTGGYGMMLTIDHGRGLVTRYAHCSKILVKVGQRVRRNEKIALVGKTGIATAPHLHYEVIRHGRPVDPWTFILPDIIVD
jgi:murein DD-endopeptidase MepM/ murein hydrolase activator NlpD